MPRRNTALAISIAKAKACRSIMWKRCSGFAKRLIKAMPMRKSCLAGCINEAKACRRIMRKRPSGGEKAAEQGDVHAQFNLGVMYNKGQGVSKDYAEAA